MKKYGRLFLKIVLWLIVGVIALVLLVVVLIQVPAVQNFAKDKAVSFLEGKIHTPVRIGHISLALPKLLVLNDVYFEDQKKDTLLAGEKLKVDISLLKLLDNQVEINEINLQGITSHINRTLPDSAFNFTYIIKAFASGQKKEPKPNDTASMKFSISKIILDRINIKYNDAVSGNDVAFNLGHFDTNIKDFDLDKMKFTVPKITLSDVNAKVIQHQVAAAATAAATDTASSKPLNYDLKLGTLDLSKIKVDYQNEVNALKTKVDLGKFLVELDSIDLKNQRVVIKNIELNNTIAALATGRPATAADVKTTVKEAAKKAVDKDTTQKSPVEEKGWTVKLNKVAFANNDIQFDNNASKRIPRGIDFMHLGIKGLTVDADDIYYSPTTISGKINQFSFSERSGVQIKQFHAQFLYGQKESFMKDLLLETPNTILRNYIDVKYSSIASISKNLGELQLNANLVNSKLAFKDVLNFVPSLSATPPFKGNANGVLNINGKVTGKVNDLTIQNLNVTGLGQTKISASAHLKGLPDVNKAYFDLNIKDFSTTGSDIARLAPAGSIPSSIRIPESLGLKGTFKGSIKNFNTNMALRSSYGSITAIAGMKSGSKKGSEVYSADIKMNNFNVGRLIKQEKTVGRLTFNAKVNGSGTSVKNANAQIQADLIRADVKGYVYRNLVLKGTARNGVINTTARMKDPNINFALDAKVNMANKYPAINATLNLDSINLERLHFASSELRLHGKIVANIPTADPDYLNGTVQITDLLIVQKAQRIQMDSISIASTATATNSTLNIKSSILTASMAGQYKLTEVGTALQATINKYYNTGSAGTKMKYSPQNFTFQATIVKTPLLTQFAPDLKRLDPIVLNGHFNSDAGDLVVNGSVPNTVYGTNQISNLKLAVNTGNNALNYNFTVDKIATSSIQLLNTSISGSAQNNNLNLNVSVKDKNKKEQYRIAGVLKALTNQFEFSLLQNGLVLDYTPWTVAANNALQFGSKGILARDFNISSNNQTLGINTTSGHVNGPLAVTFQNFKIETLTHIAEKDSLKVGGTINGNAMVSNFAASPVFTSDLTVKDFNFQTDTLGDIAIKVNNQQANTFAANVDITGKGNEVKLNGLYHTNQPDNSLDLNLNIVKLNMKSIEGFTLGSLRNTTGDLTGQIKIAGSPSAPNINGDINFNKVGFNVSMLNSYFRLDNEKISFNHDGIAFNDFSVVDSAGNKATINGAVYTKTFTDFKFALDVNANNFRAINSTRENNKLYYGKLYLNTRLRIRGDMDKPIVDGSLAINDKTDLTIVLPQSDPGIEDRQGVVEFVNNNAPKLDSILLAKQRDSIRNSDITGLDVTANITINKNANFNIVIDERNGDVVHIRGEAQLNAGVDPSGKTNLTGTYTVTDGSYNLSYGPVQRNFTFKRGSTITWTGDPTSANIDLTAVYVANVPPIDLVEDQLGSETEQTMYKQKLPFNVDLMLKGELLKPAISFDIILPDSNYSVQSGVINTVDARLAQVRQDPNELNKQVLGVLVLGHFIGDNPLQSQGGSTGIQGYVRNSVSGLLSDQLNKLVGNSIAGVDLNFDLQSGEDYSTGTAQNRTDLNVALSKKFLNDRLTVSVGNNFNLEGQNQPGQKASTIAGNVTVGYKLTKDGRFALRAYRRDEYIVIQGQVVETGIGFSFTVDYNKFKEIFKSSKELKDMRRRLRQEKKDTKEQTSK
ncbi:translocation/assembly module TamB domain-containing protein [Mucilaginibacter arboris]|uniref:Translocation/assembly module TamB n=1 Tax=Mucilaginibacter arboris TaxID=2682090 RepID=A0A7K1SUD1_9SPHI|nr:translocation/assembly module TamB domain-containing protein [Mucilaginibacter arboris]MVN20867.1 translocation/assembly module TamB [Mucilaginibacter arboris]